MSLRRSGFGKPTLDQIRRADERRAAAAKRYHEKHRRLREAGKSHDVVTSWVNDPGAGKKRKPLRPVNQKRKARLFALQFLSREYVEFVHEQDCARPGCKRRDIECAHVGKTRANGGRWFEIAPLCSVHHLEQEGQTERFNRKYRVDLMDIAARLALRWKQKIKGADE